MAKSGIAHADVGDELSKAEWLDEENHELIHGVSFPASPVERQLFYRDDEHKWYIYNGTSWVSLQGGAVDYLNDIGDVTVPTPSDGDFVEWDTATSKWIKIAHKHATTGVHGVGARHVAETTVQDLDLAAHKTRHENAGGDEISIEGLDGSPAQKAAASGLASLDASSKVVQHLANIDDTPVDGETDEPITSNWAYDHKADKAAHHSNVLTLTFIIDGGGSAITTGQKGHLEIPFACTITQVTTLADQSGSIVVDIWKDTYANFPPTDADSITASAPPTLSSAQKAQDSTLTGWTTSIAAGDILAFNVDSCSTTQRLTISLKVEKS